MLSASVLPRRYVLRGGAEVEVPPPAVGQAVTLLELLATAGDADDRALLDAALDAWLPPEVADDLRSRDEEARARRLARLVSGGYDPPPATARATAQPEASPWRALVATYCATYGADPWRVWCEVPFPFFLAMCDEAQAERARHTLSHALAAGIPHMGRGAAKALRDLQAQARSGRREPSDLASLVHADPDEPDDLEAAIEHLYGKPKR